MTRTKTLFLAALLAASPATAQDAFQSAINAAPWANGQGLLTGPTLQAIFQAAHDSATNANNIKSGTLPPTVLPQFTGPCGTAVVGSAVFDCNVLLSSNQTITGAWVFSGANKLSWAANGYSRATFGFTTPTTGDSYASPDAVLLGGTADMASAHLYIRGMPYGPLDLGTNLSVVQSDRPLAGTRAGVGPDGIAQRAGYYDLDTVNFYNQAGSTPARFIVSSAYTDTVDGQKHSVTYSAGQATFSPPLPAAEVTLLRMNMHVMTNSVGATNNIRTSLGVADSNGAYRNPVYVGQITGWDPAGTYITVDGWSVIGSGNAATNQVPSTTYDTVLTNYGAPALFIGATTKAFNTNVVCNLTALGAAPGDANNPKGNIGSQTTSCEGAEWDLTNYITQDYLGTLHGLTIQSGSAAGKLSNDSYNLHLGGPMPHQIVIDELSGNDWLLTNSGVFNGNAGPAPGTAVGSRSVLWEMDKYPNGAGLDRMVSYLQRDVLSSSSTAAFGTHSLHFGEIQGGNKGDAGTGAMQGQVVFGGPNLVGGAALCPYGQGQDGSVCNLAVFADGHVNVQYKLTVGTQGIDTSGPATLRNNVIIASKLSVTNPLLLASAPMIASGFGSGASITASNGTAAFTVNVGGGGTAGSGSLTLPAASTGWACTATDITTNDSGHVATKQFGAGTTTTIQLVNINANGGVVAWGANDILAVSCLAY